MTFYATPRDYQNFPASFLNHLLRQKEGFICTYVLDPWSEEYISLRLGVLASGTQFAAKYRT